MAGTLALKLRDAFIGYYPYVSARVLHFFNGKCLTAAVGSKKNRRCSLTLGDGAAWCQCLLSHSVQRYRCGAASSVRPDTHPSLRQHLKLSATKTKIACSRGKISISGTRTQTVILSLRCQACRKFKNRLKCCSDQRICISLVALRKLTRPHEYWLLPSY